MFISIVTTCRLHVHDLFDEMYFMARLCQVRSLFKFFIIGLVILLFIISGSFMNFWAKA